MKILQINNCHYRRGGADIVFLNTIKLLEKKGHEVISFSKRNEKNEFSKYENYFISSIDYFNINIFKRISLLLRFFYSFESSKNLNRLIKDTKPDIAHIHLYKGDLTPSILTALKRNKIQTVITLHDLGFLCPHNLMLDGKMNICNKCVTGSSLNCIINKCNRNNLVLSTISALEYKFNKMFYPFNLYFDKIIAVSKFGQAIHNSSNKFSRPVIHLYNFYPGLSQLVPNEIKGNYFLYFGRLSKEKGLTTLIEAWLKNPKGKKLKIVGTGELFNELKERINEISNIEFIGFKSGSELNELIRNASFVIVPSECYENNPLTIIEAYANGKPVIATNIGGIPEIVENEKTGFLFSMKNIDELSDKIEIADKMSEERYKKMSINSRSFADKYFNEENHYDSLFKIYNDVINDRKIQNK